MDRMPPAVISVSRMGTSAFGRLLERVRSKTARHHPEVALEPLARAFALAERSHADQIRRSGEPYLMHPLRVSETIADLGLDVASVTAGLLHDTVEDSDLTVVELAESFGRDVASLVDGVTKLGKVPYLSRQEQQAESFRKMLLAMSQDIRVLLVKLADRLDNMRTLAHMPSDKQERIARETMDIYAPLSGRLGLGWMRSELEDLSFRYLKPALFHAVEQRRDTLLAADPTFVDDSVGRLRASFVDAVAPGGHPCAELEHPRWRDQVFGCVEVRSRVRGVHRLHTLESGRERELDHISDVVRYEVTTVDRGGCYAALGQIHATFKPFPGHFEDQIALPPSNRIQGIHTAVVLPDGARMDIDIRSRAMDEMARVGIVTTLRANTQTPGKSLGWLNQLMDWQEEVSDPHEFIEAVKGDLFADEVYVFTPRGDVVTLPQGSTPIDFSFAIHTDVGLHCSGARVNGQVVPLRYQLRQGDAIEILGGPTVRPKAEWLAMCKSSRARARIRQFLRMRDRTRLEDMGRGLLEQALAAVDLSLEALGETGALRRQTQARGISKERGVAGLYEEIASGQLEVDDVVSDLVKPRDSDAPMERASESGLFTLFRRMSSPQSRKRKVRLAPDEGEREHPLLVTRQRTTGPDAWIELASCCDPVPGDPLVGYLAPRRGIIAHTQFCNVALTRVEGRRVFLHWEEGTQFDRPVTLEIRTGNAPGLLAAMSRVFSQHGVNIKQAHCRTDDRGRRAVNTFHVTVRCLAELRELTEDLGQIRGVFGVERVTGTHASVDG
ncbi:MAG: RelA/SpoT family protein [Nannocystaceae bacterium]